ncbi:MAG: cation:dicarboxylase symporter family transporter, partial [Porticoccus sp.]
YAKLSPFQRVLISLSLGLLTGIFVGEPAGILKIGGTIYIRLLQMTVLPYVLVSIIAGLGRLDTGMAANIGIKAVQLILLMWLVVMVTLLLLPLAYPAWVTAGFFSSSMVTESVKFDFVSLYIPSNIFSALSNSIVPAIVMFSILMGIALITVKNKELFINLADNVSDALQRVASFVAALAPLGIFAIAASAAGTLQPEELERLQVFLWVYLLAAALLGFVSLPLLVHWATPFSYKELMSAAGEAMVTALATGTVLVVLPMIAERCKGLLKKHGMECEETDSTVDVMVPTSYSFPSTGTLLGLGFILFSAWYVGSPLQIEQYLSYVIMGAFSAFGSMTVAIPFLLDYFSLPADQFQLYLLASVVTARFATGLAALHGFVITLLVSSAVLNLLRWRKIILAVALHLGISVGVMIAAGIGLKYLIPYEYTGIRTFEAMHLEKQPATVKLIASPIPLSAQDQSRMRLDIIRERGSIRVGYYSERLPYAFKNTQAQIVGFEIEMVHELARNLGISIELYHHNDTTQEAAMLSDGRLDISVGGRSITPVDALDRTFSDSYTQRTLGFMVTDSRRGEFDTVYKINRIKDLNLGILENAYYTKVIQELFPNAMLTTVKSPRKYFKGNHPELDALIFPVEAGSAWAILHPGYTAVVAEDMKIVAPVGLVMPKGQLDFTHFINTWLKLKKDNGFIQQVYQYWILGENPEAKEPRWSVMHNVLGWRF